MTVTEDPATIDLTPLVAALGDDVVVSDVDRVDKYRWDRAHDVMALNQRVEQALDPQGILNPGAGI